MYKFIILDIKNKQVDFFIFLKIKPNHHELNKLVTKSMRHAKYRKYSFEIFWFFFNKKMLNHIMHFVFSCICFR
jgi:hypothetical protein